MRRYSRFLSCFALLSALTRAQFSNWAHNQINTSICTWTQPRAAVLRDTVYIDGGQLIFIPGLSDGTYGDIVSEPNFQGLVLSFNFSDTITPTTNVTGLLLKHVLSKALGGTGNSNSPNFVDGAMLANNYEYWMYGGIVFADSGLSVEPDAGYALEYQSFQQGNRDKFFQPGFSTQEISSDVTRYVAYGGAASAPSENLAWYFSGMTSPTEGLITLNPPSNGSTASTKTARSFVSLDMSIQGDEKWTNDTLPASIKGRANPSVVWVPVGERGILVVLGGVTYPQWVPAKQVSANASASSKESPAFMRNIDIYDVASGKWYQQPTKNGPGALTRGCAVVAPASDASSYNIYYYGGFNGINVTEAFSDTVWVLSLPSFTWTRLNEGTELHARAGHQCFTPYPDQMMAIGGYTSLGGPKLTCLDGGPVVVFNMTSGKWMDSYNPEVHHDYGVPDKVQEAIGGSAAGGATLTTPAPSGWATSGLADVFSTTYDKSKITTFYPYAPASTESTRPDVPSSSSHGGGLPGWAGAVIGVILGLVVLSSLILLFCLWRRRKYFFKNRAVTERSSDYAGLRILSWIRGENHPMDKETTITSSDAVPMSSPEMMDVRALSTAPTSPSPAMFRHEVPDTQVPVELPDTSSPPELPNNPVSMSPQLQAAKQQTTSEPSRSSFSLSGLDSNRNLSLSSGAVHSESPLSPPRVDSPTLSYIAPEPMGDHAAMQPDPQTAPDETERKQVGQFGSVSTSSSQEQTRSSAASRAISSLVSPQSATNPHNEELVFARDRVSPLRRSVFRENEEDMGDNSK